MTRAKGELEHSLFQLVFFAAVVLAVWPLFRRGYLPIEDLPQHLAAVRVLHSYHDLHYGFERYFELQLFRTQYLAYYVLCDWLSYVMDLELANRVLMIASAMATPYALWYLLRALGRSPWLALFALPLTYNAHLILGFVNFLIAIPLALFGLGLAVRQHMAPTRRRAAALAVVGVVCFLAHVVPFALLALGCALIALDRAPAVVWKRLLPLLPAALVSLVWLVGSPAGFSTVSAVQGGLGSVKAQYQPADVAWRDLPNWLTDTLHGDEDLHVLMGYAGLLLCTLLAGALAALVRRVRVRSDGKPHTGAWPLSWRLLPLAPLCLMLYFVTPSAYDWIWPIAQRFPLLALLFAIPVLPPPPRAWIAVSVCVLLTLTLLQARCVARAFDSFQHDEVGDFDRALLAIPAQKRVMGLIYARWSRNVKFAAFIHFVAYYQARKGGAVMFTFADFPQSPFRFRESNRPPRVPPRWEWLPHLVQASDLTWYEYLLTRGGPAPCAGTCQEVYRGSTWSVWKLK